MKTTNRTYRMLPDVFGSHCVRITTEDKTADYLFTTVGTTVRGKVTAYMTESTGNTETYTVTVNVPGKATCTCKGFFYRSKCKHSALMAALVAAGKVGAE